MQSFVCSEVVLKSSLAHVAKKIFAKFNASLSVLSL